MCVLFPAGREGGREGGRQGGRQAGRAGLLWLLQVSTALAAFGAAACTIYAQVSPELAVP